MEKRCSGHFWQTHYRQTKGGVDGDRPFDYTYSKSTKTALPWTKELLELKYLIEQKTGETYNSCLLNLYHNGTEGMGWHSDDERELVKNGTIASLSLGAERKFVFKHKTTKETASLVLEHGSLLVMKDVTQTHWLHRLSPTKKVFAPRINLTFRTIEDGSWKTKAQNLKVRGQKTLNSELTTLN